jgi:hypothetical protein
MGTMPDDLGDGKKESIYRSKMNYESSPAGAALPATAFGRPGDHLIEGAPF